MSAPPPPAAASPGSGPGAPPKPLPAATRRLLPHHDLGGLDAGNPLVLAALLEDGDSQDLAWLVGRVGLATLERWLRHRGRRQLSRRSRAFWSLVLGTEPGPPASAREELWSP